jgi:hypothetical protein
MPGQSLVPFQNPLAYIDVVLSLGSGYLLTLIAAVFVVWLLYTIVVTFHWVRYSHAAAVTYPAILTHLIISGLLLSYALGATLIGTVIVD